MPKLNQLIAVVDGTKNRTKEKLTACYHAFKKPDLFNGFIRSYKPIGSDSTTPEGEMLPDEVKNTQADVRELLGKIVQHQGELFDVVYMRDKTNMVAKADVQIGDKVILHDAPVPFLLWLEKALDDLHTEVKNLPVLDPAERWTFDPNTNRYVAEPSDVARARKLPKPFVRHPGTKEHPPQVDLVAEDVRVGTYTMRKWSTAIPAKERDDMLVRVEQVQRAVKFAREHANNVDAQKLEGTGKALYDFIFTGAR